METNQSKGKRASQEKSGGGEGGGGRWALEAAAEIEAVAAAATVKNEGRKADPDSGGD